MTIKYTLTALLLATFVGGCSQQPSVPSTPFGETVRSVLESQIHDHEAAIHPNPNAVEGSDPDRLNAALEAYRGDVGKPENVSQPITIQTGN